MASGGAVGVRGDTGTSVAVATGVSVGGIARSRGGSAVTAGVSVGGAAVPVGSVGASVAVGGVVPSGVTVGVTVSVAAGVVSRVQGTECPGSGVGDSSGVPSGSGVGDSSGSLALNAVVATRAGPVDEVVQDVDWELMNWVSAATSSKAMSKVLPVELSPSCSRPIGAFPKSCVAPGRSVRSATETPSYQTSTRPAWPLLGSVCTWTWTSCHSPVVTDRALVRLNVVAAMSLR